MSYHKGMGAVVSGTYPVGTKFAAGYYVTGLVGTPANAVEQLRQAIQANFRGRVLEVGWGPKHGVPTGHLYVLTETARDGITGEEMNTIFARTGSTLQSRGVGSVRNTHAHAIGASPSTAVAPSPATNTLTPTTALPGMVPGTEPNTTAFDPYGSPTARPGFMSQSIGGIPVWGLMVGGLGIVGLVGFSLVSSARKRRVVSNRRSRYEVVSARGQQVHSRHTSKKSAVKRARRMSDRDVVILDDRGRVVFRSKSA